MLARKIYFEEHADTGLLDQKKVAVIGYGNQGRAQSLNLRDSGIDVVIGNMEDRNRSRAEKDGFRVLDIGDAAGNADIVLLLIPDERMPAVYRQDIAPNLKKGTAVCFASGYNIAYGLITPEPHLDIIMLAPRMIGVGVRERYLAREGFYSFIDVRQDHTGNAEKILLALAKAVGTLRAGGIPATMEQEALLDLFNEQAFGPAFGRVLLTAIDILIKNGLPPEAVLCEMYLSGEMSYTYKKMAQIGLVKQTDFHSHTSQYGAMSRGIRYMKMGLEGKFQKSIDEISSGEFAREWESPLARLKFSLIKFFATRQKINRIEAKVRKNLRLKEFKTETAPEEIGELLKRPELKNVIDELRDFYEYEEE